MLYCDAITSGYRSLVVAEQINCANPMEGSFIILLFGWSVNGREKSFTEKIKIYKHQLTALQRAIYKDQMLKLANSRRSHLSARHLLLHQPPKTNEWRKPSFWIHSPLLGSEAESWRDLLLRLDWVGEHRTMVMLSKPFLTFSCLLLSSRFVMHCQEMAAIYRDKNDNRICARIKIFTENNPKVSYSVQIYLFE